MPEVLGDLDAFLIEIHRRAHLRALAIQEAAQKEAEQVLQEAESRIHRIGDALNHESDRQVRAVSRRVRAQIELEAQRRLLGLREELLEQVWTAAERHLRALVGSQEYVSVLQGLARQAARELQESRLTLAADPEGHALLSSDELASWGEQLGVRFERAPEPADAWGGLLAWHGRCRYDATFPTRLSLARELLREQTFRVLCRDDY